LIFIDAAGVLRGLPYPELIDALERGFAEDGHVAPLRTIHTFGEEAVGGKSLLMMPCWEQERYLGVKLSTVFPANAGSTLPTVNAIFALFDAKTGRPMAILDGEMLTLRRTAAVSALAARFLAAPAAARFLMVGTGGLCAEMVRAHAAARPLASIRIWGRNASKAREKVRGLSDVPAHVTCTEDLAESVSWANIVCCATTAREPVIRGEWLRPGQHVDLVGGFRPNMREVDDGAITATSIFVDTRGGALAEAGDLVQPMAAGLIGESSVKADLAQLCSRSHPGRTHASEITLFKSVGTAVADLIAAGLVVESAGNPLDRDRG
jgi:ornithine cyclodeaminase